MTAPTIPDNIRAKLIQLRTDYAARCQDRAPSAWSRLHLDTRAVLLMLAGVDAAQEHDLSTLALRDWREFTATERAAIAESADALRWQLQGARDLTRV